ncbi:MAG: HAD family hydrolase [Spirochaetes bacterium]|nr:MAG: HAD family hydrolase [Spirochaetota bacterium]
MLSKKLFERLYEAATIQRWNDHVRPVEFTELDKQAHKMIIAWIIAKYEEADRAEKVNWNRLMEGCVFELLHRVILTDLKPSVFHKMMQTKGEELNRYVLDNIRDEIREISGGFLQRFERYFLDREYAKLEKRILQAAHYISTWWEFGILYRLNRFIYGIEKTREEIENKLEDFYELSGVRKISLKKKSYGFLTLCGQLRFQKRWAGTPRIPQTSVLGHLGVVAITSFLCSLEMGLCDKALYNNFYAGLFHDLPEVLTRDIISPVKRSVTGIDSIIKEYERFQLEEVILPLLPNEWHDEIIYFVVDEFDNKVLLDGTIIKNIKDQDMVRLYNKDENNPLFGRLVKACDDLSAYMEAHLSIKYGISNPHLVEALKSLKERYSDYSIVDYPIKQLFLNFSES